MFNQSKYYDIFSVACGGAHRVWHFSAADAKLDSATFLFIRKEKVCFGGNAVRWHVVEQRRRCMLKSVGNAIIILLLFLFCFR